MKILLCEDNEISARVALMVLKRYNHEIDLAMDGFEALHKFKENKYDLILMDGMMPSLCGFETVKRIREIEEREARQERVKIYALTADNSKENKEKCFKAGMDDFLSKPLQIKTEQFQNIFNN